MKQIIAIIRTEKWQATRVALDALEVAELISHRVIGRGRQRGLRYLRRTSNAGEGDMPYIPKRLIACLVADDQLRPAVDAIIKANQTGNFGDGKIFVLPLEAIPETEPAEAGDALASA